MDDEKNQSPDKIIRKAGEKYTNVPMLQSFIVSLMGGSINIFLASVLKNSIPYIYSLIMERGPVQFVTVYAFWFAIGMLIFKYRKIKAERQAFKLNYIKSFTSGREVVGTQTIIGEQEKIEENEDPKYKDLILVNRINKAIKQLRINENPADVANVLTTVADTDAAIMDSSYVLIKFMIWIIPILGFIGTVVGMTQAIGSFDTILKGVSEIGFAGIKKSLGHVTAGLSVAFDTTFLALLFSAFVNLLSNAWQKKEEDLLSDIDEFTTNNIINKYSNLRDRIADSRPVEEKSPIATDRTVLMELKNMNKQNMANAEQMIIQIGRLIEAIQASQRSAAQETPEPVASGNELTQLLNQINTLLKGQADFKKVIENLAITMDEMKEINQKLGELFSKIYNRTFA